MSTRRTKQFIILGSDILLFFLALWVSVSLRSGTFLSITEYERYIPLFLVVGSIYIILQYIVGAYDTYAQLAHLRQLRSACMSAATTFLLSTVFFYLLPSKSISPKTILLLTILFAITGSYVLRILLYTISKHTSFEETIGIIGRPDHPDIKELALVLQTHQDLSINWIESSPTAAHLTNVQTIAFHSEFFSSEPIKKLLYTHAVGTKKIITFSELYEAVCNKIPTGSLTTDWFITHVQAESIIYERIKTLFDYLFGVLLGMILVMTIIPIGLLITLTSKGPLFIKQTRIGKGGRHFLLYKFRTMYALAPDGSAETDGAVFSTKGDARITPVGRVLRKTRLDELPQVINVLRREISIIGPRPERPEIVSEIIETAPYFSARTLVMPGITGWAAVHQHYTDTTESTIEKLQYDLYYIKYRSLWNDIKILLLTIRAIIHLKGQ